MTLEITRSEIEKVAKRIEAICASAEVHTVTLTVDGGHGGIVTVVEYVRDDMTDGTTTLIVGGYRDGEVTHR